MTLDVSCTDSVETFYNNVVKVFGQVDILVNSAGITYLHKICDHRRI